MARLWFDGFQCIEVDWRWTTGDSTYPLRLLNGYMKIVLNDASITETLIGEDGSTRWTSDPS